MTHRIASVLTMIVWRYILERGESDNVFQARGRDLVLLSSRAVLSRGWFFIDAETIMMTGVILTIDTSWGLMRRFLWDKDAGSLFPKIGDSVLFSNLGRCTCYRYRTIATAWFFKHNENEEEKVEKDVSEERNILYCRPSSLFLQHDVEYVVG